MRKQQILFVDLGGFYGGIEIYLTRLADILKPHASLYAVSSVPKLTYELRQRGVTVFSIPTFGNAWCKGFRFLIACFVVPYILLRFKIGIVQLNGLLEPLLIGLVRLFGCEALYT